MITINIVVVSVEASKLQNYDLCVQSLFDRCAERAMRATNCHISPTFSFF